MNRIVRIAALVAAFCLAPAAAAFAAPAQGAPVEINVILSTTGNAGFYGNLERTALTVLEAKVNAGGGVRGRPVHFNVLDDQTNVQVTVQLINQLNAKGVSVFLGPITPPACYAAAALINHAGPVGFCLNPSAHPEPDGFQYSPFSNNVSGAEATLRYLRGRGIKRIAFLNATDGAGQEATQSFDAALREPAFHDMTKVAEQSYNTTDVSVGAQIAVIKAAGAQAIISWNVGLPFGTVLRSANDAGLDVPIVTTGGNMTPAQMQAYAAFLPSDLLFQGTLAWAPGSVTTGPTHEAQMSYLATLKAANLQPQAGYATIWDPALLVVEALRRAGPDAEAAALRKYFDTLRGWVGLNGDYDFIAYPKRGLGADAQQMFRYDKATQRFVPIGGRGGSR